MQEVLMFVGELWKKQYPIYDYFLGYADDLEIMILDFVVVVFFTLIVGAIVEDYKKNARLQNNVKRVIRNVKKGMLLSLAVIFAVPVSILVIVYVIKTNKEPLLTGVKKRMVLYKKNYIETILKK